MIRPRLAVAAACALCAWAAAGCGVGAGEEEGTASLRVTRDAGAELLREATPAVREADSVLDLLDREAEITTRYGGGFVQSIDGLAGGSEDGRRMDWFFFVNGIESGVGAAELDARAGDAIWWDRRDWSGAMRVPAVVGSYPQPFTGGFDGREWATSVRCSEPTADWCADVSTALREAGARPAGDAGAGPNEPRTHDSIEGGETLPGETDDEVIRVLVGPWARLRADPQARALEREPGRSGVFARFERAGRGWELVLLNDRGEEAERGAGGLVAAVRRGEAPPTWILTGTDAAAVAEAVEALDPDGLRDAFALALPRGGEPLAVPVAPEAGG